MAQDGKLRLKVLNVDRQFLRERVEIRLNHMERSDQRRRECRCIP